MQGAIWKWALPFLMFLFYGSSSALAIQVSPLPEAHLSLGEHLLILEDKNASLSFDEVRKLTDQDFLPARGTIPNFGFSSSVYWARISMSSDLTQPRSFVLEYAYPLADKIDFYLESENGELKILETGDTRSSRTYPVIYRLPAWPVQLGPGTSVLHLRLQSKGVVQFPLHIYEPEAFQDKRAAETGLLGVIFGIIAGLFTYNLCLFILSRNLLVLTYCAFIAAGFIGYISQLGLMNTLFHGHDVSWWNNSGTLFFSGFAGALGLVFSFAFLGLQRKQRVLFSLYAICIGLYFFQIIGGLISYNTAARLSSVNLMFSFGLVLSTAFWKVYQGERLARFFLIAWFCFIAGGLYSSLSNAGLLPPSMIAQFGLSFGLAAENIFLSLAISFKLRRELTQALSENKRINAQLREKDQARTHFFHNISHELRTPLNGILGFLGLVGQDHYGKIPDTARSQIHKSLRLAESLKQQVNTILDLAKSQRGELSLHRQAIDVNQLLSDVQNLAEGLTLKHKNSHFSLSFDKNPGDSIFISDAEHIQTILRNLIGNAFKFSDPNRINHVSLHCKTDVGGIWLEVSDQGIGIPEDFQEKIFEQFAQVEGDARRAYEGSGLGLAMVRDLVTLLGGTLSLQSSLGKGSTFTLHIPSQTQADPAVLKEEEPAFSRPIHDGDSLDTPIAPMTAPISKSLQPFAKGSYHILVVDDNEVNCELITDILSDLGADISWTLSGRQALAQMHQKQPDLILLDMMMPLMSGEDVLQALQADPVLADIPVILLTARASSQDKLLGLELGADDYLPKPIIAEELRLRVHNLLTRHQLIKQAARSEDQEKLVQMGELFSDLSHEIKNILQGTLAVRELATTDAVMGLAAVSLDDTLRVILAEATLQNNGGIEHFEAAQKLPIAPHTADVKDRLVIRSQLGAIPLSTADLHTLWNQVLTLSSDEVLYFETQMRVLLQHQTLHAMVKRTKELVLSVLTLSRNTPERVECSLEVLIPQLKTMVLHRSKTSQVRFESSFEPHVLEANPSKVLQILLNLTLNAIDAVAALPEKERWVQIESSLKEGQVSIQVSNGGPQIPPHVQSSLFQRGFSTKGDKGTGIGLNLSLRLAESMHGMLSFDEKASHPRFVLTLASKTYVS